MPKHDISHPAAPSGEGFASPLLASQVSDRSAQPLTHTPGPWVLRPHRIDPRKQVIVGHDDYHIGTADDHNGYAVNKANAQLLIAAPDLLDALQKLRYYAELSDDNAYGTLSTALVLEIANEALAKALWHEAPTPGASTVNPAPTGRGQMNKKEMP